MTFRLVFCGVTFAGFGGRCEDQSVIGTSFYVMEFLEGRIFTDVRIPEIKDKEERRKW